MAQHQDPHQATHRDGQHARHQDGQHAHTAHQGDPHDHTDVDWAVMGPYLEREAELYTPVHAQAAAWLRERQPRPALIVDAGSGPGVVSCLLAESFPEAEVVAVDGEEALLERARDRAARTGLAGRLRTLRADLPGGLGGLDGSAAADLLWAGRSLHHLGDQRAALATFADHLAPGGVVALLEGGLSMRYLPRDIGFGRPGLQSRIAAAEDEWFAQMRAALPDAKDETEDWSALLAAVGLRPSGTRSFLLDLPAPLSEAGLDHVVGVFARRRDNLQDGLAADDLAALDRLIDPDDPAGLRLRPDVFVLGAQTVHTAVKDGR